VDRTAHFSAHQSTAGTPRNADAAAEFARYERRSQIPIVLSAVLPLMIAPTPGNPVSLVIAVATWLVFVGDLVVHLRLLSAYLRTGLGWFDLAIVILTAPWFLLPGVQVGGAVVVLRLARLARLMIASKGARQLIRRLGRVAIVALSLTVVGAFLAYYAEHPSNPEFATIGDALWWAIVTLTTVGYGDITPITFAGRLDGVAIMITGVAVLGLLAGALANFFRLQPDPVPGPTPSTGADPAPSAQAPGDESPPRPELTSVIDELARLRGDLDRVTAQLSVLAGVPSKADTSRDPDDPPPQS
jgi:voltage-gated potassium channel